MNLSPAFYIISAARESLNDAEIASRTATLLEQVHGIGYAAALCKGHYGGVDEPCILVIDEEPGNLDCFTDMLRLARIYRQESVLAVDCNRAARLLFTDYSGPEALGLFVNVSQEEAKSAGDYTERDGRFYTCVAL